MRLQEVLREREAEITVLEESLKGRVTSPVPNVMENVSHKANGLFINPDTALSPNTINQFDHIRKSIENGTGTAVNGEVGEEATGSSVFSEPDESLERLNELMLYVANHVFIVITAYILCRRSMAQKESTHREVVDDLDTQLSQVRRQLEDLTTLSRDQVKSLLYYPVLLLNLFL
jgi:hypothetical protein